MNKYKYIKTLLFIILVASIGCSKIKVGGEFLQKPPSVDVTIDTIFADFEHANRVLTHAYTTLHYGLLYGFSAKAHPMDADNLISLTDLGQTFHPDRGAITHYYNGSYNAGLEESSGASKYSFFGSKAWEGIRYAWIYIENIDRVPDIDEKTKARTKAEAKMIIAMNYSDMFRIFGTVPWLSHAAKVGEDNNDFPRPTVNDFVDSLMSLINSAIPALPWVDKNPNSDKGRFTKAGAMGLKARILLFAASPLFNSDQPYLEGEASELHYTWNGGYDPSLWQRAANACKDLLDEIDTRGGYALVNTGNPREDFRKGYFERESSELLISTRVYYRSNDPDFMYFMYDLTPGHGVGQPTQEYVEMYPMENGKSISDPSSGFDPSNPYENRDPRLYETILTNGDKYRGRTAELWVGGLDRRNKSNFQNGTGYGMRKFLLDNDAATSHGAVIQWPYLRLPEIYLSYAEALNEINDGPTPLAYEYLNKCRNRVDVGEISVGSLNKEEFREAVLTERALELGYEEVRWYDIIRWKRDDIFKKKLHGMNIYKDGNSFTYEKFELPGRAWQDDWSPKWYLSALPPSEVNKGYGLVQNPGW